MVIYILCGTLALLTVLAAVFFVLPILQISAAMRKGRIKVENIIKTASETPSVELARFPAITGDKRTDDQWVKYLSALKKVKNSSMVDVLDYISLEKTLEVRVNLFLTDFFPAAITAVGVIASALLLVQDLNAGGQVNFTSLYLALAGLVLGFLFLVIYMVVYSGAKKNMSQFVSAVHGYCAGGASSAHLLAEISESLKEQYAGQNKLYEMMTDKTSDKFAQSVIPVLEGIEKQINAFIAVAVERQVEGMENLANRFAVSLSASFSEQLEQISGTIGQMEQIQRMTTSSFEVMQKVSAGSMEHFVEMQKAAEAVLVRFDGYLGRLASMSDALDQCLRALTGITDNINHSSQFQTETIHRLGQYQEELSEVSKRYVTNMDSVITDIRDQYHSTMIALRSASADMVKSGDHLRSAYGDFSTTTTSNIANVFDQFDQNLAGISAHLAKTIGELQEAVDELPAIMKQIQLPCEGSNQS